MSITLLIIVAMLFLAYYACETKLQNIILLVISVLLIYIFLPKESYILFPFFVFLYALGNLLIKKPVAKYLIVYCLIVGYILIVVREHSLLTRSIISFLLLNSVAFLHLCYTQNTIPQLTESGLYILYFPKIICGPYERTEPFLNILKKRRHFSITSLLKGLFFILLGILERYAFAGNLSIVRKRLIDTSDISIIDYIFSGLLFGFEIFFIISAFTNWAKGTSIILGIPISDNFRFPFLSRSVSDFWRRWHISVHNWLKDFIYEPMKKQKISLIVCLLLTFLISAIWHKVTIGFLIWGTLASGFIILERKIKFINNGFWGIFWVLTVTSILWIFFQINDISILVSNNIKISSSVGSYYPTLIVTGTIAFFLTLFCDLQNRLVEDKSYYFLLPLTLINLVLLIVLLPNKFVSNPIYGF